MRKPSKKTLAKLAEASKDLEKQTIAGMTFDDFKNIWSKTEKAYQKNLRVGGKQKTPKQIAKGQGKFAWIYSEDKSETRYIDEYHRNVKSFHMALTQLKKSFVQWISRDFYKLTMDDVDIVGTISFGDKNQPYENKVLTDEEILDIVLKDGVCKLKLERKVPDKNNRKHIQGWAAIYTMEALDKEENELKEIFQKEAQEEADRTGKKAVVTNLIGWRFEAEPKQPKSTKAEKKSTCKK